MESDFAVASRRVGPLGWHGCLKRSHRERREDRRISSSRRFSPPQSHARGMRHEAGGYSMSLSATLRSCSRVMNWTHDSRSFASVCHTKRVSRVRRKNATAHW